MDEMTVSSLQESLPFSQETCNYIWDIVNQGENGLMLTGENVLSDIVTPPLPVGCARSSLPATVDWPGGFNFCVMFGAQEENAAKHVNWTFSNQERKLYVKKDVPCPVHFSTASPMWPGVVVRAMAVYTSPQHASESVHRCVNHSMKEIDRGNFEAEHLIRSESRGAIYIQDAENKRHSVIVPFENPPAGQGFSTYIYKFACWSSCAGGPNRRPLTLVFTLEQNNTVIGRRSMDIKICACPGRDSGITEKVPTPSGSKKLMLDMPQGATVPKLPAKQFSSKRKSEVQGQELIVETKDVECYKFLKAMQKFHRFNKRMQSIPDEYKVIFQLLRSSSSEDETSHDDEQGAPSKKQ